MAELQLNTHDESDTIRVCTYNIHKGFGVGNTHFLLKHIRDAIRTVDANMVFLQEVVGENQRRARNIADWAIESQFEFLADSVWHHHAYGKNALYDHGHHGNAILSSYPLSQTNNFDLSVMRFSDRGILQAKVLDNLHLFCVHFGLFFMERKAQVEKMLGIIRREVDNDAPIIIAGDFNDWHNRLGETLQNQLGLKEALLETYGVPKATFPAFRPKFAMDRIYYRGLSLLDAKVLTGKPWSRLSDHCAVYAEFSK